MEPRNSNQSEARLDELFRAYREACPDPDPGVNFMPAVWAKIEAREVSATWFSRVARALVTVALAACVILGLMASSRTASYRNVQFGQSNVYFNDTFVDAVQAEHTARLEPLHTERISYLEPQ